MINFDFYMPSKIYFGENCLERAKESIGRGTHAFIVTGKTSARACGAYRDITELLDKRGVEYTLFDKIGENPLLSVCCEGGKQAHAKKADFVIGIGGGSPLDAAKAIAAFAANVNISPGEIFTAALERPLPLVLIPTTSGTGSEANNYSILTTDDNLKKTFKNDYSYAQVSVVDPKYTYTLNENYTVSTALDAFCHCIESYLSPKSTCLSSMLALYGAELIWNALGVLNTDAEAVCTPYPDIAAQAVRRDLSAASLAGGIAINTTGTGFPHPLGYSLTLEKGVPHGRACAAFMGEYIKYNMKTETGAKKLYTLANRLSSTPEEIAYTIPDIAGVKLKLDAGERKRLVDAVCTAANFSNSPYVLSYEEMLSVYGKLFI